MPNREKKDEAPAEAKLRDEQLEQIAGGGTPLPIPQPVSGPVRASLPKLVLDGLDLSPPVVQPPSTTPATRPNQLTSSD